ncbi:MAG: hypothetical protein PUQ00_32365 [Nostoc sp. S13]|nr:hypothetical protein [Nostoc sp. S13]
MKIYFFNEPLQTQRAQRETIEMFTNDLGLLYAIDISVRRLTAASC